MIKKIDHIGIVIRDMEEGKRQFGKGLGLELIHEESSNEWNVKAAFFNCGDIMIELLQPIGPGLSQEFLDSNGEGIQHICYEVDNIHNAMENLKENFILRDKSPRIGAFGSKIFFIQPDSIMNIETEIVQKAY